MFFYEDSVNDTFQSECFKLGIKENVYTRQNLNIVYRNQETQFLWNLLHMPSGKSEWLLLRYIEIGACGHVLLSYFMVSEQVLQLIIKISNNPLGTI